MRHARPATIDLAAGAVVRRVARSALALAVVALAACGGGSDGGGSGGGTTPGFPSQTGCEYQYSPASLPVLTGADPLIGRQWHLENTGQDGGLAGEDLRVLAAWSSTRGAGARIAIVDDALETLHEDLAPNVADGASYNYREGARGSPYPLPCFAEDTHGTSVAGIAAGRDGNKAGGAGVAPRASVVGYNALATGFEADLTDALTRGLAENGVYNNSWGSPDDGRVNPAEATFLGAIDTGIGSARGGRGAVYVFPAGNGGCYAVDTAGRCYHETSGLDGYLNHRGVIAVGAVDHRGRKPDYAESGANVLLVAPTSNDAGTSAITTTAVRNQYRSDFGGTSASVPMASGVAALVLSARPDLTWRDVRLILAQTARRNDPGDAGWTSSAFGPAYHPKYGFGVADAAAAVNAARTWVSVGGSAALKSCGPYPRSPALALPDAVGSTLSPREDRIVVGADCTISRLEYVEVSFAAAHSYAGDLRLRLVSPNGLVSELVDERVCDGSGDACGAYADWRFGSVRHLGEPAAGAWTLRVTDAQPEDSGTWQRWSLRLWGR